MPALGMTQDTGKLVAWMKQPGDAVAVGDVLFEVETDKSVAEVEAQQDGFLTDVSAADGEDVPVGQVIAMISETAEDGAAPAAKSVAPGGKAEPALERDARPASAPGPEPRAAAPRPPTPVPNSAPATGARILASPKARRLAAEDGLDLARLAQAGHPQPYHVTDLEVLRTLPTGRNSPDPMAATGTQVIAPQSLACQIAARVPRSGVSDFLDWMDRDGGVVLPPAHLFVSFAARTLRAATGVDGPLTVALVPLSGASATYADPDRCRLSALRETDAVPDLTVRDLTASRLTGLRLTATGTPTLSIAEVGDDYTLTLDFTDAQLPEDRAIAMMKNLANRLATPLLSVL